MTDKEKFIDELGQVFKKYNINYINGMKYINDGVDETILICYRDGFYRTIDVKCDSKPAMIKDIIKQGGLD